MWTGTRDRAGYGAFRPVYGENMKKAHRFAYEAVKGPIPEGYEVDHLCRVRSCVRPDHLEAVTRAENLRRMRNDICPLGHQRGIYGGQWCCPTCRRKQLNEWQNANRARLRANRGA